MLGRNGVGKTLTLHTLAGLRAPSSGQVSLDGRELANGFSELNDPEDQAARFREQVARKQSGDLEKYAKGAAAGGALALLLGSRGGRSLGGKALKIGTVAALGTLAWKAYHEWQARQSAPPAARASVTAA